MKRLLICTAVVLSLVGLMTVADYGPVIEVGIGSRPPYGSPYGGYSGVPGYYGDYYDRPYYPSRGERIAGGVLNTIGGIADIASASSRRRDRGYYYND